MKILAFSREIPATPAMPGSPRLFSLCRDLRPHRVTLVTFAGDSERLLRLVRDPAAADVFDEIVELPAAPAPAWLGRQLHRLRQQPHWGTRFRAPAYHALVRRRIREMLAEEAFDLLYVDGLGNAQYVDDEPLPCPAVIDLHDSLTLLYGRNARMERRWLPKLRLYAERSSIAREERALGGAFRAVITNSPVDTSHIRALDPTAIVWTIGNGVDCDFFRPGGGAADPDRMVFTGVMDYGPNVDAAIHFVHDVLPLVRARHPHATLDIVGQAPTGAVRRLGEHAGVTVVGEVPDIRPFLDGAGVFVCPLRWGAGVKNKLLAALAMEKPVVATRRSAEGLDLRDGEDLLLADDPRSFAAAVGRLMEDPDYARGLAASGRRRVTGTYSWSSSARSLERILRGVVDDAAGGRPPAAEELAV